ncbi:DNA-directed RNA polymerase subunit beta [Paenibacillus sp. JMULE4]|uniref:DNA-directed RNA polymerase subunit beta n=1 Tax=Paenibacillus sp. JMULE4 TaxID=2518342 RepID=UPI0035C855F1
MIRWTWFPLACAAALFIGLTIGFVYVGKQSFYEMFDVHTWRHIFDLIYSDS